MGELDSNDWHPVAKGVIVGLVLGITILCLVAKGIFFIWLCHLQRKQDAYLGKERRFTLEELNPKFDSPVRFHMAFDLGVTILCLIVVYIFFP